MKPDPELLPSLNSHFHSQVLLWHRTEMLHVCVSGSFYVHKWKTLLVMRKWKPEGLEFLHFHLFPTRKQTENFKGWKTSKTNGNRKRVSGRETESLHLLQTTGSEVTHTTTNTEDVISDFYHLGQINININNNCVFNGHAEAAPGPLGPWAEFCWGPFHTVRSGSTCFTVN